MAHSLRWVILVGISLFILAGCEFGDDRETEGDASPAVPASEEAGYAASSGGSVQEDTNNTNKRKVEDDGFVENRDRAESADQSRQLPSCVDPIFTFPLVDSTRFSEITPLGLLSPTAHVIPTRHLYFRLPEGGLPLSAPSDMHIVKMSLVEDVSPHPKFGRDYALYFYPCQEFAGYLDHVVVSDSLKEQFDQAPTEFCREYTLTYPHGPVDWKFCRKNVQITVKKGELLGTGGGAEGQNILDVAAFDFRIKPHAYANPKRWEQHGNFPKELWYAVCALDYFSPDIRSQFRQKLKRTGEPSCGEVAQDISGTAQGNWVTLGQSPERFDETKALALVHDFTDPSRGVFSVGNSIATLASGTYQFTPKSSGEVNRDFKKVLPGNVYCYEKLDSGTIYGGIILLQLISPSKLKIEGKPSGNCGQGPWSFSAATEFER